MRSWSTAVQTRTGSWRHSLSARASMRWRIHWSIGCQPSSGWGGASAWYWSFSALHLAFAEVIALAAFLMQGPEVRALMRRKAMALHFVEFGVLCFMRIRHAFVQA